VLLKRKRRPLGCKPRRRSVRNANPRRKAIVRKESVLPVNGGARKDKAGKAADQDNAAKAGREIAKAGAARTVGAKVAGVIEGTTGVAAIAAASKARRKSTSRS